MKSMREAIEGLVEAVARVEGLEAQMAALQEGFFSMTKVPIKLKAAFC